MLMESATPKTYALAILYCLLLVIISSPFISKETFESENLLDMFYHNADRSLNTCVLKWNVDSINGKTQLGITEAPIFYPYQHTKFYAEHLYGELIFAWPLSLLTHSPYWLYILIYELNRVVIGFAAFLLVLQLTSIPLASIFAGGLMISGWRMAQLQNTSLGFVILTFVFLIKHDRTLRWRDAFGIYFFLVLSSLSSGYFAFYAPVAILIVLAGHRIYQRSIPSRIWFLQISAVLILTIVTLLPTMYVYKQVQTESGLRRPGYTVRQFVPAIFGEKMEETDEKEDLLEKDRAKPLSGIACLQILLFVYAIYLIVQRKLNSQNWVVGFSLLAVLSFWMATIKESPYALLWHLPGFNGLRAAHRWSLFLAFALTGVNGVTLAYFQLQRPKAAKTTMGIVLGLFAAVAAIESNADTIRTHPLPESHVYEFLKTIPEGPILIAPLPRTEKIYTSVTSARMLFQLSHYKPMVLGYSGFVPKLSRLIKLTVMNQRLNDDILRNLATIGVRYVIIDNLAIDGRKDKDFLRSSKFAHIIYDHKDEIVAELNQVLVEKDIKKLIKMWKEEEENHLE
jgi:hypothetical protein